MVSALRGARVEPIGAEPFVGSYPLSLTEAGRRHCLFEGYSSKPKFHFGNYERVVAPPDGAILLASSEAFDVAALDHGGGWLTVQFHPEASHEAMAVDYRITHPHLAGNYEPLPQAPKLLANFLKGAGVVGEARVVRGRRPAR